MSVSYVEQQEKRKLSINAKEAWDQLQPKRTTFSKREIKNLEDLHKACQSRRSRRDKKLLQRVNDIMSISNKAAVLCAARLGKTRIENMTETNFEEFSSQIKTDLRSFHSPDLEKHLNLLKFNDFTSCDDSGLVRMPLDIQNDLSKDQALQQQHNYWRGCNQQAQDPIRAQPNIFADVRIISKPTFLLCVGTPAPKDVAACDLLGVTFNVNDIKMFKKDFLPETFKIEEIDHMREILGKRFIRQAGDERIIHQAVVATLFAREIDGVEAEFQSWTWLLNQIRQATLLDYIQTKKASNILIVLSNTSADWEDMSISQLYGYLQVLAASHGSVAVCPSFSEAQWANGKIGDIGKLDMIAQQSDTKYSFRPKTCLGIGMCTLPGQAVDKMVVKRSLSCGAGHVEVVEGTKRDKLSCYEPGSRTRSVDVNKPIYFHQEYIDSLLTFGEYRIYICKGKIIARAFTKFEWDGGPKNFGAKEIKPGDFSWFSNDRKKQEQKSDDLDDFAIFQYSQLLKQFDSRENYRSLRAGVRLDIGISELNSDGRFFVLEVTRLWAADQMSKLITKRPYIDIPKEWISATIKEYRPA
ncbi:hypothetical protein ACHAPK_011500 [Fusarium culmorum]